MLTKENGFALPVNWKFPDADKYTFTFIALFITLLAIYFNSFYGEWHFDDYANIVNNPYIQINSFTWAEIKNCIYGLAQERPSRPLSYLSFALNHHFHGMDVFGFHVVNFAIHYLAAVFLFLFIFNLFKLPLIKDRYSNIAYPVALLATFFWAVNPVWVTSISYIVQRMASMAGLFYIMSMYFYLKSRTSKKPQYTVFLFILCVLSGLAALLSKENAVMLPVCILLLDLFLIQGFGKDSVIKYIKIIILPFFIILSAGLIYTGGFSNAFGGYELRNFTMIERLLTEPRIILFYLTLLFYPINSRLTLLYDVDISHTLLLPWTTLPSILIIFAFIAFAFFLAKKYPLWSFLIIFYFLNHLIEGSFFSLELIYEHRNYIPAMLLFIPVAEFIIFAIDYFSYNRMIQFTVAFIIVIILAGLGDITYRRNAIVASDYLLWLDNSEKYPKLSRPYANLAAFYYNNNQKQKVMDFHEKALSANNFGGSHALATIQYNIALYYFDSNQNDLALDYLKKSDKLLPDYLQNTILQAKIKMRENNINDAKTILEAKLHKYPNNAALCEYYSFVLLKSGKINEAQSFSQKNNNSITSLMITAEVCHLKNNFNSAIYYWKKVRVLSPQNAYVNLALVELYKKTKNSDLLKQEIHFLLCLKGTLSFDDYVKQLFKDRQLLVYAPDPAKFKFLKDQYHL
jgi:protein O-mannosyl-transferase